MPPLSKLLLLPPAVNLDFIATATTATTATIDVDTTDNGDNHYYINNDHSSSLTDTIFTIPQPQGLPNNNKYAEHIFASSSTTLQSRHQQQQYCPRPLTTHTPSLDDDMNIDFSPDSPPYLSSGSTKSASSPPSSLHNGDTFTNDTANFEDISLQDSKNPCCEQLATPEFKVRPRLRTAHTYNTSPPSPSRSFTSLKDLPNGLRTTATLNCHAKNRDPLSPRLGRQRTWGASSPSLSSSPAFVDRTPSPNRNHFPSFPRSTCSSTPRLRSENSPILTPSQNRTSWQRPPRKSAKELEDEYNDSDEDLPDDAIIWNIPLSARPRDLRSASASPERDSGTSTPKRGGLSRVSSWQAALSDLSVEVQTLTAKLESLAEDEGDNAVKVSPTARPTGPRRSKTMSVLPPIQKPNPMIDPLPCSAEKEKVLARTRPSWLPPKCPKEEKKHIKEYQRMMAEFEEAQKRRSAALDVSQKSKDKENMSATQVWTERVLPNWETSIRTSETKQLWWRGIPSALRGQVWQKAIGNDLHLTSKTYDAALKRARATERKLSTTEASFRERHGHMSEATLQRRSLANMHRDIATTLPALALFQTGRPLHQALMDILMAYAAYRFDTGYVRGTASMAALILLQFSPSPVVATAAPPTATATAMATTTVFIALANFLNRPLPLSFCLDDTASKSRFHARLLASLAAKMPRLHAHLTSPSTGLRVDEWADPLVQSAFSGCGLLALAEMERVWDVLVFEGDAVCVDVCVGVLRRVEGRLYGARDEVKAVLGWDACGGLTDEAAEVEVKVERFRVLMPGAVEGAKQGVEELLAAIKWAAGSGAA